MSDTPRTDKLFFPHGRDATAAASPNLLVCMTQYEMLERELAALREQLAASRQEVEVQKAKADKHYELGTEYFDLMVKAEREIAALRDVLSRLIKVHDAMGGKCGTVRIAAEEALLGKAQSEYICTCGIRVTPHKCHTDNDF